MKVVVADFGLNEWYGDCYDYEERLLMLKELGYDGIERMTVKTESEAMQVSALAKKLGMAFATVRGNCGSETIAWSSALEKDYVWAASGSNDFDTFCRQTNAQIEVAERYGVKVAVHNHLGLAVETEEQLIEYMKRCPESGLILDVGHMVAAHGDPLKMIDMFFDRIVMVHLKDFVYKDKDNKESWQLRLRFCELGAGEMGDLNKQVIEKLLEKGYDGWIAIEHDTHLQDPKIDLKISRDYMRNAGI